VHSDGNITKLVEMASGRSTRKQTRIKLKESRQECTPPFLRSIVTREDHHQLIRIPIAHHFLGLSFPFLFLPLHALPVITLASELYPGRAKTHSHAQRAKHIWLDENGDIVLERVVRHPYPFHPGPSASILVPRLLITIQNNRAPRGL